MIKGNIIELIPATLEDKKAVYEWCFHSETTKYHAGMPNYPDTPIATWDEFFGDEGYVDYFFTGAQPENGRGYIIMHNGESVGFISYSSFHLKPYISELDIWMNSEANCGKGFGVDAIVSLGNYLFESRGVRELIMRPSVKNVNAIKAYMKAGFARSDKSPEDYLLSEYIPLYAAGDYGQGGDVLLVKRLGCPIIKDDVTLKGKMYPENMLPPKSSITPESDEERKARIYPIILNEYNTAWSQWFAEEKERLGYLIGAENIVRISHIGSTAVPGLIAKPTVDILLEIYENTDIERLITTLPDSEYICLREQTIDSPDCVMILKGYTDFGFAEKVYHIHVRYPKDWDELYFIDYLIAHPETAAEYGELKRRLLTDFENDRDGYTNAKGEFIRKITRKARMNFNVRLDG